MENKKETKYLVGSMICGLLTVFGIVTNIISMITGSNGIWFLWNIAALVFYAVILCYAFFEYKKPHGNLLKYIMLIYAIFDLTAISPYVKTASIVRVLLLAIEIGIVCYIAGRLANARQNLILMIIVVIFQFIFIIYDIETGLASIGVISALVTWLDICVAYFLRYKEHREAGLMDKPKE